MQNRFPRRYKNYIFLIPLFAAALFYQIAYSVVSLNRELHGTTISEVPFTTGDGTVRSVSDEAAKAGLRPGDQILAVDGRNLENERILVQQIRRHKPKELLVLTIIPKGQSGTKTLLVPVRAASTRPATASDLILTGVLVAMMLFCVLVGVYVAAILPNDVRAIIFFGLMLSLSQVLRSSNFYDFPEPLWTFASFWYMAGVLSWSIWLVCFGLYFPERFQWDLRRPWLKWLFLGPLILWNTLTFLDAVSALFRYRAFPTLDWLFNLPGLNGNLLIAAGITFFFVSLGIKMGTAATGMRAGACAFLSPVPWSAWGRLVC